MENNNSIFDKLYIKWQNQNNYSEYCMKQMEDIINILQINNTKKVLDLCCGCGYHSLYLKKQGFKVYSLDSSDIMREYAKSSNNIDVVSGKIKDEFPFHELDIILCLNTSIGYENDDLINVLTNSYKSLKANGLLILDLINVQNFKENFKETLLFSVDDYKIIQHGSLCLDENIVRNTWNVHDKHGNNIKSLKKEFTLKLYTLKEIQDIYKGIGFTDITLYGGYKGEKLSPKTNRMLVILKK